MIGSQFLIIFASAFVLGVGVTPLARRLAVHLAMIDYPSSRKFHRAPVPLLGGVALYVAVVSALIVFSHHDEFVELAGILLGATLVSLSGLWDDKRSLGVSSKLMVQVAAAFFLLAAGIQVRMPLPEALNIALTLMWVLVITNAFNLLDNMDGLCGGVGAIAAGCFMVMAALNGQYLVGAFAAALAGACLGFLFHNFRPARIFLGDGGSLFIGFLISVVAIKLRFPMNTPWVTWMVPVLVLGVPLFDTTLVILSRMRRGLNPLTSPGTDHVSHRLTRLGLNGRDAVLMLYLASSGLGGLAILVSAASPREAYGSTLAVGSLMVMALLWLERSVACTTSAEVVHHDVREPMADLGSSSRLRFDPHAYLRDSRPDHIRERRQDEDMNPDLLDTKASVPLFTEPELEEETNATWKQRVRQTNNMPSHENPVRILQALSTGDIGGTEMMLLRLLTHLDRSRFTTEVSVLDNMGPVTRRLENMGIRVHDLSGTGGLLGSAWRLRRFLAKERFDLVHLYGFRMGLLGRIVAQLVRPRPTVIQGIRGAPHVPETAALTTWKTSMCVLVERLTHGLVDAYFANSHGAVDYLTSHGLPEDAFTIIPNGIDAPQDRAVNSSARGFPEIVCVANFRPCKRHIDLIEALALLRDRGIFTRSVLYGDGRTRPEIEALARRRQLDRYVEFAGLRPNEEVRQSLSSADIFVLPSLLEGLPVCVLEAMAAGLPVVATNVAGTRELVSNGVNGLLVPEKNPTALADALERLVRDPKLRVDLGTAGRARFEQDFGLAQMTARLETTYHHLTGRAPERRGRLATWSRGVDAPTPRL